MPLIAIGAALVSSTMISPIMTVLDTSIIYSQLHRKTFQQSVIDAVAMYRSGSIKFFPPFNVMNLVYSSTYMTANLTEIVCERKNIDPKYPKLIFTSAVNIAAITYKDIYYSKLFQTKYTKFPLRSYILFGMRDSLTIAASFAFKKDLLLYIEKYVRHNIADLIASFVLPISAQLISTPIHILAIDLYQNPNMMWKERFSHIRRLYWSVCIGRMTRVVPAFCIGGFANDMIRGK
jgi:hypothetical protein